MVFTVCRKKSVLSFSICLFLGSVCLRVGMKSICVTSGFLVYIISKGEPIPFQPILIH